MKTLSVLLLSIIILASCKKESEASSSRGKLSYKLNGELITYEEKGDRSPSLRLAKLNPINFGEPAYELVANNSLEDNLQLLLYTDSLKTINYRYDSTDVQSHALIIDVSHDSPELLAGRVVFVGDFLNVTITSYANGKISGNFSARLSPYSRFSNSYNYQDKGSVIVTEGQFSNVKVFY